MNVSATANTKADPTTGLPLFLFNLLNSWRGYVFVVVAVVVAVAVLIVVEVVIDFGHERRHCNSRFRQSVLFYDSGFRCSATAKTCLQ